MLGRTKKTWFMSSRPFALPCLLLGRCLKDRGHDDGDAQGEEIIGIVNVGVVI